MANRFQLEADAASEAERLDALRSYGVLDTAHEAAFDAIVRVASTICEVPVALVTLIDDRRQWFLASTGLEGVTETPREIAFCTHAIRSSEIMVVEDATLDARFAQNPLVVGDPNIRFYAGCPLVDGGGHALGTLCVVGSEPRKLSPVQADVLRELSVAVVRLLEARRADNALRAAENAARKASADLAIVLDASPAPISYWDESLRIRFANQALASSVGLSVEQLRGSHARDVFGEERFAADRPKMEAALRGEAQHLDAEVPDAEGRLRHLSISFTPDVQQGRVVGFIATAGDVTDLTTALITSQRRTELLVLAEEVANLGHWHIDGATRRVYWSPQIYRIYGRDPSTFTPTITSATDAFHPDDAARVLAQVERAFERGDPFEFEARLVHHDGTVRRIQGRGQCETGPADGSAPRSIVGVLQDVTEQLALRERLALHDRLVTTGTLAAGVGHEINNPLTYVTANLEIARDALRAPVGGTISKQAADEVVEMLNDAREGAERIRKIVGGLCAFAREDEVLVATDAREAIRFAGDMAAHQIRSCARLIVEDDAMPRVVADKSRLSQVFVNLLTNAAQSFATKDPEKNRILVRAERLVDGRVSLEVADNGPGIRAEVLPRIFDPFFTTKPIGRGTGLGLAICHEIVASMGGEITCTTLLGVGTTFRVILPAANDGEVDIAAPSTPESLPTLEPARGRVLVVDDEIGVGRTIERALCDENDVTKLSDPRDALRLLCGDGPSFDLVFCDLAMPHLNGVELYERVRAHDAAIADRFVFVTGGTDDQGLQAFLTTTSNECLRKPFSSIGKLRELAHRYAAASRRRSA